MGHFFIKIPFG